MKAEVKKNIWKRGDREMKKVRGEAEEELNKKADDER